MTNLHGISFTFAGPAVAIARALAGASAATLVLAAAPAGATTVSTLTLQNTLQTVATSTTEGFTTDYVLADPGTITVSLSDQLFPYALTQLQFTLLSGAGASTSVIAGGLSALNTAPNPTTVQTYTWQFQVAAGTYSTVFQAAAAPGTIQFPGMAPFAAGAYRDIVTYSPNTVPLAPARDMLIAAFIALGVFAHGGRRRVRALAPLVSGSASLPVSPGNGRFG